MKRSYTFEQRSHILGVLEKLEDHPETAHLDCSQRIKIASGNLKRPSVATVNRWKNEALTKSEMKEHLSQRGRAPKLTEEKERLLCGFACYHRLSHESVSLQRLQDFCSTHLHVNLSYSAISKRMTSWGFSRQRAMTRESRLTTQKVVDDAIELISTVRDYGYPLDRIIVMDETGTWSNVVAAYTYHFRNGYATAFSLLSLIFLQQSDFCVSSSSLSRSVLLILVYHNPFNM
jgi:transposase